MPAAILPDGGDQQRMAVPLSQGKVTYVSPADYPRVAPHKWCAVVFKRGWYASGWIRDGKGGWVRILLHRFLLGAPEGVQVDHRDGDGLNNVRGNIRLATHAQNRQNERKRPGKTSRFKGVCWHKRDARWEAKIKVNKRTIHLGQFTSEQEAALAYNRAAAEHFREFACLNPV